MQLGNFKLEIPQGNENNSGYVVLAHNTKYTIKMSNLGERRCDAWVEIDGKPVGGWRLDSEDSMVLERPVHDTGCFTFYQFGTSEAKKAGLVQSDELGLISVLFKPEKPYEDNRIMFFYSPYRAGGTGLSGKSEQEFSEVNPLRHYDEEGIVRINLRLVCASEEPRPLTPAPKISSTPIPPPLA